MNKAVMLPVQPKWVEMIKSGEKEYEFRNYPLEVGMKVYIYESKGKFLGYQLFNDDGVYGDIMSLRQLQNQFEYTHWYREEGVECFTKVYEGSGMVVAEAVVEECYELDYLFPDVTLTPLKIANHIREYQCSGGNDNLILNYDIEELKPLGYTNQRYAIKLKDIKFYDEPIDKSEFVLWNKVVDIMKHTPTYFAVDESCLENNDNLFEELEKGISECDACVFDTGVGITPQCSFKLVKEELIIKHAPQSKVFVVEREE